jgi:site-specific DNA-methyltransferase (adenine-specific)
MVRDLKGTVQNEQAAIGLLITLAELTSGMKELAVHSPRYKSELWNKEYPSIQIRTIAELLEGRNFDLPPMVNSFKKAQLKQEQPNQLQF